MTTGASNDIQRATQLARNMVTKWGLSEKLGPLLYESEDADPFSGAQGQGAKGFSDETTAVIDSEIKEIIDTCYERANVILHDNRDILDAMANALMKYETIDSGQLDQLLAREDVSAPEGWDDQDRNSSGSDIDGNASAASADDQATVAESDLDADNSDVPGADEAPS